MRPLPQPDHGSFHMANSEPTFSAFIQTVICTFFYGSPFYVAFLSIAEEGQAIIDLPTPFLVALSIFGIFITYANLRIYNLQTQLRYKHTPLNYFKIAIIAPFYRHQKQADD
jgi:hypothetical protein